MDPRDLVGEGTLLVDGTICPTWDWKAIPGLYSGKARYPPTIRATVEHALAHLKT